MSSGERARGLLARLRRGLVAAFTDRLAYKLAAVLISFVLWLTLRAENPVDSYVPVTFDLALDSSLTLLGPRPQITAYAVGSRRALSRLASEPPVVRRAFGVDAPDSVTLELEPADVLIPGGVNATVRDVQPQRITLRFVSRISKQVPVLSALRLRAAPNVRITGAPRFEPESVTVTGSREAVEDVDAIPTAAGEVVVVDGDPVEVPLDTTGLRVRVLRGTVRVRVPVDSVPTIPDSLLLLPDTLRRGAPAAPDAR